MKYHRLHSSVNIHWQFSTWLFAVARLCLAIFEVSALSMACGRQETTTTAPTTPARTTMPSFSSTSSSSQYISTDIYSASPASASRDAAGEISNYIIYTLPVAILLVVVVVFFLLLNKCKRKTLTKQENDTQEQESPEKATSSYDLITECQDIPVYKNLTSVTHQLPVAVTENTDGSQYRRLARTDRRLVPSAQREIVYDRTLTLPSIDEYNVVQRTQEKQVIVDNIYDCATTS